jgi:hypothetical protein
VTDGVDDGRFRLQVDRQTKGSYAIYAPRNQRDEGTRNTIRSFRSRRITA